MPLDDPAAGGAQGTGRGHVFLFLEGEDLAADDAAHTHPIQAGKGNEHAHQVGAHLLKELRQEEALVVGDELGDMGAHGRGDEQDDQHVRQGVDNVHDALHDHIHRTAEEAGDGAVERTNDQHDQRGGEADDHGHSGGKHGAHHDIAAVAVGAEHMGEHLLAVGDALQLVVGVAEGLGGVAQGLVDLLLAHTLVLGAAAGLGLGADERLVLAAELLAAGGRLRFSCGNGLVGVLGGGGLLIGLLGLKGVMPGVEVLCAGVELVVSVGYQHGANKSEQHQQYNHAQGHHGHHVLAQAAPGIRPVGYALALLDEVLLLPAGSRGEVRRRQVVQLQQGVHIGLKGAKDSFFLFLCHFYSPFVRSMRGSTTR